MNELFTIELSFEEWIEVIIAINSLAYSRKVYENNEEKANQAKDIANMIQKQITLDIIYSTKKESR